MGACLDPGLIVTEYISGGDLDSLLRQIADKKIQPSTVELLRWAKDIAEGMNWLHQSKPPIIHKDLKPANILVRARALIVHMDIHHLIIH